MLFLIVIHKDDVSDFHVRVPDLPGCVAEGETIEKAIANVRKAIQLHLHSLRQAGELFLIVEPDIHRANPDYADGIWHTVTVDVEVGE